MAKKTEMVAKKVQSDRYEQMGKKHPGVELSEFADAKTDAGEGRKSWAVPV